MKQPGFYYATHKGGTSVKLPAYIENAYELLDENGEWYHNREDGYLYYMTDGDISQMEFLVPDTDVLLRLQGSNKTDRVENIEFHGINFQYGGYLRPSFENGLADSQNNFIRETPLTEAGKDRDSNHAAAIELSYAQNIVLKDCKVRNTGITAIRITNSSKNNQIYGCEISEIAGGGIVIGDPGWREAQNQINVNPSDPEDLLSGNDIINNSIHHIGTEYASSTAISITYGADSEISHNDIVQVPYSALHLGYGWGELNEVCTKGISVKNNYIDGFMTKLSDGGAIYTNGATGGTEEKPNVISENYIKNQYDQNYGAIYFDEGSSNWNAADNVMENCRTGVFVSTISPANCNTYVKNTFTDGAENTMNPALNQENIVLEDAKHYLHGIEPKHVAEVRDTAGLMPEYRHMRIAGGSSCQHESSDTQIFAEDLSHLSEKQRAGWTFPAGTTVDECGATFESGEALRRIMKTDGTMNLQFTLKSRAEVSGTLVSLYDAGENLAGAVCFDMEKEALYLKNAETRYFFCNASDLKEGAKLEITVDSLNRMYGLCAVGQKHVLKANIPFRAAVRL